MNDLISRQDVYEILTEYYHHHTDIQHDALREALSRVPPAEPERKMGRKFLEIVTEYPKVCTYPEYEGKPYYSIKYEENGEMIVGFGTYKPEVLSQYLREYFISSAEPERKKGKWQRRKGSDCWECSECHAVLESDDIVRHNFYYCYHCGADMMNENGYMNLEGAEHEYV